jgi:hypothetical protein
MPALVEGVEAFLQSQYYRWISSSYTLFLLGIVAGITKLGARVGERVAKNTKLK